MKNRILIMSDMEGCIGIYPDQDHPSASDLMCREVSLLIDTLKKFECFHLYYCDCHNNGLITKPLEKKYQDVNFLPNFWDIDFDLKFNYAFMTGFHAKSGTGILAHSFRNEFKCISIDGIEIGEVGLFINWLAYHNVTTVFLSGDDIMCQEVTHINGLIINISKTLDDCRNADLSMRYESYINNVKKAMVSLNVISIPSYNPSKICLTLNKKIWMEAIICKEVIDECLSITFENTIDFMRALYSISQKINQEIAFRYSFIKRIKKRLKNYDRNLINDNRLSELMNSDFWDISHSDMQYIESRIWSLSNEYNF